ncbi:MAG: sensor histidine kinase [Lachnospiraceae bacterium]
MKTSEAKTKSSSIAGKLYRMLVSRMFSAFFWMDILIAGFLVGGFLYYEEMTCFGKVSKDISLAIKMVDQSVLFTMTPVHPEQPIVRDITLLVDIVRKCSIILLAVQGISLLTALAFDYFRVKGKLRPLSVIAENAENISNMAMEADKFQNLAYAIEHVSPDSPTDHVVTNDRDLQGIEMALNNLLDRMREAYRQQGRFVSDASHELRTPIAVIKGYADMLDRWGKEDKQVLEEAIAAIKHESDHMNKLVEQLLFLARGDSGRQQMIFEKFSLTEMMKEVYDESVMIDVKHRYKFLSGAGDILAYGDVSMLKQSVRILIDNAAKYTDEGDKITLRVGMTNDFHPYVSVQDNGIGMSRNDVQHIFERFYRSDTARNSKTGGSGLGLSIAKWIIDRHHGTIEVVSMEDIGTRFTVKLSPLQQAC